jgi:hypothetical protein
VSFRCAFDSTFLHRCARRVSSRLEPGAHVLRVRAVGRGGSLSSVVSIQVRIKWSVPELRLGPISSVGQGAGVAGVGAGGVWVPLTRGGTLAKVDPVSVRVLGQVEISDTRSNAGESWTAPLLPGTRCGLHLTPARESSAWIRRRCQRRRYST